MCSIGTRDLWYIYKQRFRVSDSRESVIVNKLALEYRKIKAISNGSDISLVDRSNPYGAAKARDQFKFLKRANYESIQRGLQNNQL